MNYFKLYTGIMFIFAFLGFWWFLFFDVSYPYRYHSVFIELISSYVLLYFYLGEVKKEKIQKESN